MIRLSWISALALSVTLVAGDARDRAIAANLDFFLNYELVEASDPEQLLAADDEDMPELSPTPPEVNDER